ncbi:two-component sensor histidine kinase [Rhodococcus sp. 15-1154-1]|nr:histidine kinase [Rhodococcus sp. 15-1154-1]OZF08889.1 two-component sensor histidine kinase [Rhodococcus sp. 15-1154-1]
MLTPYFAAVIVVASFLTLRPLGVEGEGLLVLCLLVVNSVVMSVRTAPEKWVPARVGNGLIGVGIVASAALLPFATDSIASVFPFFVAGSIGYRFRPSVSLPLAASVSVACAVSLAIADACGIDTWPPIAGLVVGMPALLGYSRRNRVAALEAQIRERALAERARIARDIHDVLAHSLSGVTMQLEVADALLDGNRIESARESIRRAQSLSREGLVEARRAVQALRDDALPLVPTLRDLVGDQARFEVHGSPREPSVGGSQFLIRSVQEAMTNAHRHAPHAPVDVALTFHPKSIELTVDNQASELPSAVVGSGMGLVGMRERAALVGGTATAGPTDQGWRVHVTLDA